MAGVGGGGRGAPVKVVVAAKVAPVPAKAGGPGGGQLVLKPEEKRQQELTKAIYSGDLTTVLND